VRRNLLQGNVLCNLRPATKHGQEVAEDRLARTESLVANC
jgi:hypothetical protein